MVPHEMSIKRILTRVGTACGVIGILLCFGEAINLQLHPGMSVSLLFPEGHAFLAAIKVFAFFLIIYVCAWLESEDDEE